MNKNQPKPELAGRFVSKSMILVIGVAISQFLVSDIGKCDPANSSAVRTFELNGKKLYVPPSWSVTVRTMRGSELAGFEHLAPHKYLHTEDGAVVKIGHLGFTLCSAVNSFDPSGKQTWRLVRRFDAPEIPTSWCIHDVQINPGPSHPERQPRLGINSISKEVLESSFGPIDQWGFRPQKPPADTNQSKPFDEGGLYMGALGSDVSISGGALSLAVSRRTDTGFFSVWVSPLSGAAIAVDGISAHLVRWYFNEIDPSQFRAIYWRSQALLNWLTTEPAKR